MASECACVCKPQSECEDVRARRWVCVCLFVLCALWAEPRLSQHGRKVGRAGGVGGRRKCWVFDAKMKCHICPRGVRACAPVFMCAGICSMRVSGNLCNYCPAFFALARRTAKCWWTCDAKLTPAIPPLMFCAAKHAQRRSKSSPNVMWLQVLRTGRPGVVRCTDAHTPRIDASWEAHKATCCKKDFHELSCEADLLLLWPRSQQRDTVSHPGTLISLLMSLNLNGWN